MPNMRRFQMVVTTTIALLLLLHSRSGRSFSPAASVPRGLNVCHKGASTTRTRTRTPISARHVVSTVVVAEPCIAAMDDDVEHNVELFDPVQNDTATSSKASNTALWNKLVPLIPGNNPQSAADVSIQWKSPREGSERLLQHLFPHQDDANARRALQPMLHESLATFSSLVARARSDCKLMDNHNHDTRFKARIVATRGPSGTKCPRWHVDHVPMRWIQSLVGPGCDYVVGSDGIQWEVMNGIDDDTAEMSTEQVNSQLVDESIATIRQGQQGQGVVLWGAESDSGRLPAVHKSPTLGPFQGRVLLTIDVVQD